METRKLSMALIYPRDEGRAVQKDRVAPLAQSMQEIGLRTPITVRAAKRVSDCAEIDAWEIVCGRHRYEAALTLQWQEIDCFVTTDDELHSQLWEIDENLMRTELSAADEASYLKRRKEIWRALNPNNGENFPTIPVGPGRPKGFAQETSEKTGRDKKAINQKVRRAEELGDDIDRVRGTSLDKGVELDALVALPKKQRERLIAQAEAGEKVSAAKFARVFPPPQIKHHIQTPPASKVQSIHDIPGEGAEYQFNLLVYAWEAAADGERQRFRQWIDEVGDHSERAA